MSPDGFLDANSPPALPRAVDILGPPQYPKGFQKQQRKPSADSRSPAPFGYPDVPIRPSPFPRPYEGEYPPIGAFSSASPLPSEYFKSPGPDFGALPPAFHADFDFYSRPDFQLSRGSVKEPNMAYSGTEETPDSGLESLDDSIEGGIQSAEGGSESKLEGGAAGKSVAGTEGQPEGASERTEGRGKVAPRSSALYRIGPPFQATHKFCPFFSDIEEVHAEIHARIDRGFERGAAGNWIGYKRNYFTLVSAVEFRGWDMARFARSRFHIAPSGCPVPIAYFALGISVQCSDPDTPIGLVQHTPKRDKGPKLATPVYAIVPGGVLPDHHTVQLSCNKRNDQKLERVRQLFEFEPAAYMQANGVAPAHSVFAAYPPAAAKVARFERIQFTASLRVKPASCKQKYFTLAVDLLAFLGDPDASPVVLATARSAPLLVRGRSPSKYPTEPTSGFRP